MMYKILFIVPYFGKFNNYFQIWLESCRMNPTIDWLIITDSDQPFQYPKNVHVKKSLFAEFRNIIQSKLDTKIVLERPYKLCDFKPMYGYILEDDIKGYDFWGYCDVDLIWGNLRLFVTDDVLSTYDRISMWGHCCLLRNNERMNNLYKTKVDHLPDYKEAYSSELAYLFDEKVMKYICEQEHVKTKLIDECFFDASFHTNFFKPNSYQARYYPTSSPYVFKWDKGDLQVYYIENGIIKHRPIMYLHMQKRKIEVKVNLPMNSFWVYDSIISNGNIDLNEMTIRSLSPHKLVNMPYVKDIWHRIKVKYLGCSGVNCYKFPKNY